MMESRSCVSRYWKSAPGLTQRTNPHLTFARCAAVWWCLGALAWGQSGSFSGDDAILEGGTPSVSLKDTDGVPQEWRLYHADEFRIDDTSATTTPFSIAEQSPTNSLHIASSGAVGIGTHAPLYPLDVEAGAAFSYATQFRQNRPNGPVLVKVRNTAPGAIGNQVGLDFVLGTNIDHRAAARIACKYTDINEASRTSILYFRVASNGEFIETMRLRGNRVGIGTAAPTALLQVLNATCNGNTWTNACSRTLKHDIAPLSTEAAREAVMSLQPVTYAYNSEPEDPQVGFVAEDVPELVATPDRQRLSSLEIVAALTRVVQEQQRDLSEQERVIEALTAQNKIILERLAALESRQP
jgi:hypothetical protein